MKKTYEKPMVMFENFELSQNIAACAWDVVNLKTPEECGALGDEENFNQPAITIFADGKSFCEISSGDYEDMTGEKFCYTVSSDSFTIFNS
jgi:hypothetical protein